MRFTSMAVLALLGLALVAGDSFARGHHRRGGSGACGCSGAPAMSYGCSGGYAAVSYGGCGCPSGCPGGCGCGCAPSGGLVYAGMPQGQFGAVAQATVSQQGGWYVSSCGRYVVQVAPGGMVPPGYQPTQAPATAQQLQSEQIPAAPRAAPAQGNQPQQQQQQQGRQPS